MNLKDAFLCVDCDEVFTIVETPCNPRCPICASSVLAPLSSWVQTWAALEKGQTAGVMEDDVSTKIARLEIIRSAPIAA